MAAASNAPTNYEIHHVDGVYKWVMEHVDDAVPKGNTVKIMMMGMRSELSQSALESMWKPSDLYRALDSQNVYRTKEELLARFIYALELLNRQRVNDAIGKLPQELKPARQFDPSKQLRAFQFYQTLVKICIMLRDSESDRRRVVNYCAHVCGMTARDYSTRVHDLIEKLLHKGMITQQKQQVLAEGLIYVHALSCFKILQNYRNDNGLPEMNFEEIRKQVRERGKNIGSDSELTDLAQPHQPPSPRLRYPDTDNYSLDSRSTTPSDILQHRHYAVQAQGSTNTVQHHYSISESVVSSDQNYEENTNQNRVSTKYVKLRCCTSTLAVLVIILAALFGLLFAGMTGYSNKSPPIVRLYYGNSSGDSAIIVNTTTVILSHVEHYTTKKVTIEQKSDRNDTHEIFLYQFHEKCSSIRRLNQYLPYTRSNTLSGFNNFCAVVIFYLHEGAEINLNVCAEPNSTTAEMDGTFFRVILDRYEGTETCSNQKTNPYPFLTFDSSECKTLNNLTKHSDYYIIRFFAPSQHELNYNYTLDLRDKTFNLSSACSHQQLLNDKLLYNFSFSSKRSCIVAELKPQVDNSSQGVVSVDLRVMFEPWPVWSKVVGFSIASGMFIVMCLCICLCVCLCVCCRRKRITYVSLPQHDNSL